MSTISIPDTCDHKVSDFEAALIEYLLTELDRVYWNYNQHSLADREDWQLLDVGEGFEFRRYYWGDNEQEASLPNLKFSDVSVTWYKHPGRSMRTNATWTEAEWRTWFDAALRVIRLYDTCGDYKHARLRDTATRVQRKNCEPCVLTLAVRKE